MDRTASLIAQQLCYSPGSHQLISDILLSNASGKMLAIIGPNGTVKSTLLRLLTGYLVLSCSKCWLLDRQLEQ